MKKENQVIKVDGRGRVRTSAERREGLLDEFEQSGLSGMKFAAVAGIKYQTFAAWAKRRKLRRQADGSVVKSSAQSVAKMRWLEAVVEQKKLPAGSTGTALMIYLPGGARIEIGDVAQATLAAALLRGLEAKPALSCSFRVAGSV